MARVGEYAGNNYSYYRRLSISIAYGDIFSGFYQPDILDHNQSSRIVAGTDSVLIVMERTKYHSVKGRRGQALVMLAFAMTAIVGFLALAVDLGLAYSIRKSAQAAADAAALAGAQNALGTGVYSSCTTVVVCQALAPCGAAVGSPPSTIGSACLYALQNGFSNSSNNGYVQTVNVASNTAGAWPGETGVVATDYWVMVQISEQIPQIFSAVLGNPALIQVSSVAAIVQEGIESATVALVQ